MELFLKYLTYIKRNLVLAYEKDISTDYLSEIECGKKIPRWDKLDAIANSLEIETYKLVMKPESS